MLILCYAMEPTRLKFMLLRFQFGLLCLFQTLGFGTGEFFLEITSASLFMVKLPFSQTSEHRST